MSIGGDRKTGPFNSSKNSSSAFSREKMFDKVHGPVFNSKEHIGKDAAEDSVKSSPDLSSAAEKALKSKAVESNKEHKVGNVKSAIKSDVIDNTVRTVRDITTDNGQSASSKADKTVEDYFIHKGRQATYEAEQYKEELKNLQRSDSSDSDDESLFKEDNNDSLFKETKQADVNDIPDKSMSENSVKWIDEELTFNDNRILSGLSSDKERDELVSLRDSIQKGNLSYENLFEKNVHIHSNNGSHRDYSTSYIDYLHSKGMSDDDIKVFFGIDFDKIESPLSNVSDYAWTSKDGQASGQTSVFVSDEECREAAFDSIKDNFTEKKDKKESLFLEDKADPDDSVRFTYDTEQKNTIRNSEEMRSEKNFGNAESSADRKSSASTRSHSKKEEQLNKKKKSSQKKAAASYALATALRAKRNAQDELESQGADGSDLLSAGSGGALKTAGSLAKDAAGYLGKLIVQKFGKYIVIGLLIITLIVVFVGAPVFLIMSPTLMAVRAGVDSGDDNSINANDLELDVDTGGKRFHSLSSSKIEDIMNQVKKEYPDVSDTVVDALYYALDKVGCEYNQGRRMNPGVYDCSSLVFRAYKSAGLLLPCDNANWAPVAANLCYSLENQGKSVDSLYPGDLLFYGPHNNGRWRGIYHVTMYVGKIDGVDMVAEAYGTNYGVVFQPVRTKRLVKICRPVK